MKRSIVLTFVLALVSLSIVAFGQSITVIDNASSTAPVETTRVFGAPILPSLGSIKVSTDSATSTEDITSNFRNLSDLQVSYKEVASTSSLVNPTVPGVIYFQYNSDNNKMYIRVLDADGADWGCVATLSADMTQALN